MKHLKARYFILGFIALILLSLLSVVFLLIDDQPLVSSYEPFSPAYLRRAKNTVKYTRQQFVNNGKRLVISIDQVSELLSLLSQLIPRLSTRLKLYNGQLIYSFTLKIPDSPAGRFLNVSIRFHDPQDLSSGTFSVGSFALSNAFTLKIISLSLPLLLDQQSVESLRKLVLSSGYNDKLVFLEFTGGVNRRLLLDNIFAQLKKHQAMVLPDPEFENLAYYYEFLLKRADNTSSSDVFSVFDFLQPLMIEAGKKSYADPVMAARQNESALIALGLFLGDAQLKKALPNLVNVSPRTGKKINAKIAGRKDLKLHFLYSAIVQILTNRGISLSLGEIKEISDMDRGGTGFSFVDIAADRAGLHFATLAIDPAGGGLFLQNHIKAAVSEQSFFPDISLLAEEITQQEFVETYTSTESAEYALVIEEIDRRIHALPLYKVSAEIPYSGAVN